MSKDVRFPGGIGYLFIQALSYAGSLLTEKNVDLHYNSFLSKNTHKVSLFHLDTYFHKTCSILIILETSTLCGWW